MCLCSCFCPSSCSSWHSCVICTGPCRLIGGLPAIKHLLLSRTCLSVRKPGRYFYRCNSSHLIYLWREWPRDGRILLETGQLWVARDYHLLSQPMVVPRSPANFLRYRYGKPRDHLIIRARVRLFAKPEEVECAGVGTRDNLYRQSTHWTADEKIWI